MFQLQQADYLNIVRRLSVIFIYIFIIINCYSCATNPPPLEFAPSPTIIEKAIAFQLDQQHHHLSQQLKTNQPKITITKIDVDKIVPKVIFNLPTYHLEGTYQLELKLNKRQVKEIINSFQIDLQRQKQGKTWRMLIPNSINNHPKYFSYRII